MNKTDAYLSIFSQVVYGTMPAPFVNKNFRMTQWHKFVLDALCAMVDES